MIIKKQYSTLDRLFELIKNIQVMDKCIEFMEFKNTGDSISELADFNREKFKQLLQYVIYKTNSIPNVGKTVLYKILYFTEFNYYEKFEEKLSGETYLKYPYGPAPRDFDEIIHELKTQGLIQEKLTNYGYSQKKFTSIVKPDTSKFTKEQIEFIDEDIDTYSSFNATEISEHSHKDTPYIVAEDFEELDYELVFYRSPELSVRIYDD